jgi:hypothetical protein
MELQHFVMVFCVLLSVLSEMSSLSECSVMITTTGLKTANRKRRGIRERYHSREMPRKQRSATASPILSEEGLSLTACSKETTATWLGTGNTVATTI